MQRVLGLALLAVLCIALSACHTGHKGKDKGAKGSVAVGTYTLTTERLSLHTELPGRTSSPMVAEIRPQVSGIVKQRLFTEGAMVKAGQVLYRIDAASYQAAFDSAKAAVAKAEATAESARLTAKRQAELAKIDAISQQDNEDAQAQLKQAEADLASAKAAQETARIALERTAIVAPISGLVDISAVTPGALVTENQTTPLTTVRQTDPMQVDITQSSADVLRLKRALASGKIQRAGSDSASVKLLLEDGSTYSKMGTLRFAGVSVNPSTGAITLRALFDNPDGLLLPGMYVRAVPETGVIEQALLVPQQAVARDVSGATTALVVDANNKVEKRNVVVAQAVGNRWLVASGLQANDRVIVEGTQKVKAGDTVQPHDVGAIVQQSMTAEL